MLCCRDLSSIPSNHPPPEQASPTARPAQGGCRLSLFAEAVTAILSRWRLNRNSCASGFSNLCPHVRTHEDGNWRIMRGSPRNNDDVRTRPRRRGVVRELVVPRAAEHFDYLGPDGAGRRIHTAWNGP